MIVEWTIPRQIKVHFVILVVSLAWPWADFERWPDRVRSPNLHVERLPAHYPESPREIMVTVWLYLINPSWLTVPLTWMLKHIIKATSRLPTTTHLLLMNWQQSSLERNSRSLNHHEFDKIPLVYQELPLLSTFDHCLKCSNMHDWHLPVQNFYWNPSFATGNVACSWLFTTISITADYNKIARFLTRTRYTSCISSFFQ